MSSMSQDERRAVGQSGQVSVLASDLVVNGVVASEGTIELHGKVEGEVAASTLVIGNQGRMNGKVQVGQLDVRGEMDGSIICTTLTLRSAARLRADVQSAKLVIESGAEVEGRFSRPTPPAAPAAPRVEPTPVIAPITPEAGLDASAVTSEETNEARL